MARAGCVGGAFVGRRAFVASEKVVLIGLRWTWRQLRSVVSALSSDGGGDWTGHSSQNCHLTNSDWSSNAEVLALPFDADSGDDTRSGPSAAVPGRTATN